MKKPIEVYIAAVLAGGCVIMAMLTGCGSNEQQLNLVEKPLTLKDGRTVNCVYGTRNANDGGISCDWESIAVKPR